MDAITTTTNTNIQNTAKQYIVVKIDNEQYGINIQYVDNIVRMQKITRVPKSQSYFAGVINLRGEIMPVMSMRRKFGLADADYTDKTRIIIIKVENSTVGIIVDQVNEVVTLDEESVEKVTVETDEANNYISAVGKSKGELISLLNIQSAISDKESAQNE